VTLVAKAFDHILFDAAHVERDLKAFRLLLDSNPSLSEKRELQPFFKTRKQLSAFIGTIDPKVGLATELAFEYQFFGDFAADLVLGNKQNRAFSVIEFEDGRKNSIFVKLKAKTTKEWSRRFDHGFSQLVDWFWKLDDLKKTDAFRSAFGEGHVRFSALLIAGRSGGVSDEDRKRLDWRTEKVRVDSHSIECVTYDDLYEVLANRLKLYPKASRFESGK
jgi:hypothetical protein